LDNICGWRSADDTLHWSHRSRPTLDDQLNSNPNGEK
jgi:hypothetical protein